MKDLVKRAAGGISSAVELYRKLSRRERLVGWSALATLLILSLCIAALGGGSGDGTRTIEVPAGSERAALAVVAGGATGSQAALDAAWLDQSPGLFEPPERFAQRLAEQNRRRVDQAIRLNPKIKDVSIAVSSPPRTSLVRRSDERGSAAVAIALKAGAAELTRGEVEAIREHVRCAFGMRAEDVAINDFSGRRLAARDNVGGKEEDIRQRITDEVQRAYRGSFREGEVSLSVLVSLSQERQSVEKKEMDREKSFALEVEASVERGSELAAGGVMTPSAKPVTLSETSRWTPYESYEKIHIDIPPGVVDGVSLIADFDVDAVLRVEDALRNGGAAAADAVLDRAAIVKSFVESQERWLRKFLGIFKNVSATVMVHSFDRSARDEAVAAAAAAAAATPAALASGGSFDERAGPGAWASFVALGIVLSGVLVLWVAIARRQSPRWASSLRPAGLRSGEERSGLSRFAPEDGLLDSVGHLSARVRERPDVAASILRVWLHQDAEDLKEEAVHS